MAIYPHAEAVPVEMLPGITRRTLADGATMMLCEVTLEQVLKSTPVAEPLRLLHCSPVSDGAAAVLLCPLDQAHKYTDRPVQIIGTGLATSTIALAESEVLTGGFDAEYGNAQSGVVELKTREGGDRFAGEVRAATRSRTGAKQSSSPAATAIVPSTKTSGVRWARNMSAMRLPGSLSSGKRIECVRAKCSSSVSESC